MSVADHFAANLRAVVEHAGLSVNGAAQRWKVPTKTLEAILKRQRTPSLDTAENIAAAAGYELWQMIAQGFDPSNPPVLRAMSKTEAELYERIRELSKQLPNGER